MNSYFANYLFGNETIFLVKSDHFKKDDTKTVLGESSIEKNAFTVNKAVLILARNISEAQQELIKKIISSVNISMESTEIIDVEKKFEINISHNCRKILVFGSEANILNLGLQDKYSTNVNDNSKILLSDNLTSLELNQNDEKRKLWNALKEFNAS